jgi:hypothetical protein
MGNRGRSGEKSSTEENVRYICVKGNKPQPVILTTSGRKNLRYGFVGRSFLPLVVRMTRIKGSSG